jgi:hypothetical protein
VEDDVILLHLLLFEEGSKVLIDPPLAAAAPKVAVIASAEVAPRVAAEMPIWAS